MISNNKKPKTTMGRHGTRNTKKLVSPSRENNPTLNWFFDEANKKILASINDGHIQEGIIQASKLSKNATLSRLKKMVQSNILEKCWINDEIDINKTNIIYKTTKACTKRLVGDEEAAQHNDFKSHEQKYEFDINQDAENIKLIKSIKCINTRAMKNWKYKDFYLSNGNTIRITPKKLCWFSNTKLEADTIDNLNIKYVELAKADVRAFSKEYNIRYSTIPRLYQPSTFDCISTEPLAKIMRERGNFNIKASGIKARIDPSDKGIESDEQNAREIEFRLFKMPQKIEEIERRLLNIESKLDQRNRIEELEYKCNRIETKINQTKPTKTMTETNNNYDVMFL